MQDIDNDMDELFRKAGEDYPLRTDGADWESMSARLSAAPADAPISSTRPFRGGRLWWLSLLLLPVALLIYNYQRTTNSEPIASGVGKSSVAAANSSRSGESASSPSATPGTAPASAGSRKEPSAVGGSPLKADHQKINANPVSDAPDPAVNNRGTLPAGSRSEKNLADGDGATAVAENAKAGGLGTPGVKRNVISRPATHDEQQVPARANNHLSDISGSAGTHSRRHAPSRTPAGRDSQAPTNENASGITARNNRTGVAASQSNQLPVDSGSSVSDAEISATSKDPAIGSAVSPTASSQDINNIPTDSTTALRQPNQADSVSTNNELAAAPPVKVKMKKTTLASGFYYGLMVGPDVSSVKSQKVKNVGYSVGAILGYRFDKHWSAEAGVWWDKKDYWSKGEYFDKGRSMIPQGVGLKWVNGECGMLEFPIAVRYDLNLKRSSFFGTVGITSYLMKKEDYSYGVDNAGATYVGYREYKNSGGNLFSNMQLSFGYNYHLTPRVSLRLEPYVKVPLSGVGIGSLPLSSKGVFVGITRSIK